MQKLRVKRHTPDAVLPTRATPGAVGYDLRAAEGCVIEKQGKAVVPLELSMVIPEGHYGRIAPRSGLAAKHHIDVGAGVIDPDYRGKVSVVLFNLSPLYVHVVKKGDAIAQLILEKVSILEVEDVAHFEEHDETQRGEQGFGSTGN